LPSLLHPNIFFCILFLKSYNLCFFLKDIDWALQPYRTTGLIIVVGLCFKKKIREKEINKFWKEVICILF
jgi:hypothetical protein